jgi:Rieske 2Fe-2S family protein
MRLLTTVKQSLSADWYLDHDHYERELRSIWYREWVCVGRLEALEKTGDFFLADIGSQSIIVTRSENGDVRAFHNTCRHRGSALCRESHGRFRNNRIICPYHTWTYLTDGALVSTPGRFDTDDFDAKDYSLYSVAADTWAGFIFVNLAVEPETDLMSFLGDEATYVENWPLAQMRSVHQEIVPVACNWKIFWENYNECYHCPRVHPELCKVMPDYKDAVFDPIDVPGWKPAYAGDTGRAAVAESAETWSMTGQLSLPVIEGPTAEEIECGVVFSSIVPSMYVVAHPDYVRSVRVVPTGPESIDLVVDWMLPKHYEVENSEQLVALVALAKTVVAQDGDVCELNQKGLHSNRHQAGILVAQEFELWNFHEWVRNRIEKFDVAE